MGEALEIPEISDDDGTATQVAALEGAIEYLLERRETGRDEIARGGKSLHRAVAAARGDEGDEARALFACEVEGTKGPVDGFFGMREGRLNENEGAEIDVGSAEDVGSAREVVEGHALVHALEGEWVNGFEAHRDFETREEAAARWVGGGVMKQSDGPRETVCRSGLLRRRRFID